MEWTDILVKAIISIIGIVTATVIPILTKVAFAWLKEKAGLIQEQKLSTALVMALDEAEIVAGNVVAGLEATLVYQLREKSKDGTLSKEDIELITQTAFESFKSDISAKSYELLENNADNIMDAVGNLIEKKLKE